MGGLIPQLQQRIDECNTGLNSAQDFVPLTVEGATVGYLKPE